MLIILFTLKTAEKTLTIKVESYVTELSSTRRGITEVYTPKRNDLRVDPIYVDALLMRELQMLLLYSNRQAEHDFNYQCPGPITFVICSVIRNDMYFVYNEMYLHNLH